MYTNGTIILFGTNILLNNNRKVEENMINSSVCKCCSGTGTQVREPDKIVILCPCCNGTGNPPNTVTY